MTKSQFKEAANDTGLKMQLAMEFVRYGDPIEKKMNDLIDSFRQNPLLAPQAELMEMAFKATDLGLIEQKMAEAAASVYTEEELRALVDFYKTPLGQSARDKSTTYLLKAQEAITFIFDPAKMQKLLEEKFAEEYGEDDDLPPPSGPKGPVVN